MPDEKKLNARKSLIIGVGSTGAMICNQILERISWTYGHPDNVPWMKFIVLETAPIDANKAVSEYALCHHMKITEDQYENLITNPQNYGDVFDFPTWDIPSVTKSYSAVEHGAQHIRILGRLAFFFNYDKVDGLIRNALKEMGTPLNEKKASEAVSQSDTPTQVSFLHGGDLHVYVVGSLCGGTASGCFIDLGYYLRALDSTNLITSGIFLLPSKAEDNPALYTSAYTALLELNHFSDDGIAYGARFPGRGLYQAMAGMSPFKYTYLIQGGGPARSDYARLVTSTADYLFSDAIGDSGIIRDKERTDASKFFVQKDLWGASQKFYTFGQGVIEFPFAKVYKGCTLRLAKRGFQLLRGGEALTETQAELALASIPITNKGECIQFLTKISSTLLADKIARRLLDAHAKMVGSPEIAEIMRSQIDAAFDGGTGELFPDLPQRVVRQTIETNGRQLRILNRERMNNAVRKFLTDPQCFGLSSLTSFLNALETRISLIRKELDPSAASSIVAELNDQVTSLFEKLLECHRDRCLSFVCQKRRAKERYAEELSHALLEYYEQRLIHICYEPLIGICDDVSQFTSRIKARLQNQGMIAEVDAILGGMDSLYNKTDVPSSTTTDGWGRTINGTELFAQGVTIREEYERCIRTQKDLRDLAVSNEQIENMLAIESVGEYVEDRLRDLLLDVSKEGRFDNNQDKFQFEDLDILDLAKPARRAFQYLGARSIIDRLVSEQDCDGILKDAAAKSQLFLDLNVTHPRHVEHPDKHFGFVLYDAQHAQANEFGKRLEKSQVIDSDVTPQNGSDPHQILVQRERAAFSLGIVSRLLDEMPSQWRFKYEETEQSHSNHSRGDIREWVSWSRQSAEERATAKNLFLLGIALDVITFREATEYRFEYEPLSPADPGYVRFGNNLDEAVATMRSRKIEGLIYQGIRDQRTLYPAAQIVDRLIEFIKQSGNRFVEADISLTIENIQDMLLNYIMRDEALLEAYKAIYRDVWELSLLKADDDGAQAYYCPICKGKLGYTTAALYVIDNSGGNPKRVRRCAYCGKSLERPSVL